MKPNGVIDGQLVNIPVLAPLREERRKNVNVAHGQKCAFKFLGIGYVGKSAWLAEE